MHYSGQLSNSEEGVFTEADGYNEYSRELSSTQQRAIMINIAGYLESSVRCCVQFGSIETK